MGYRYELHPKLEKTHNTYKIEELNRLTTLQLRDICRREKIVVESKYNLDRQYLIETIFKFRGEEMYYRIENPPEGALEEAYSRIGNYLYFCPPDKQLQIPERLVFFIDEDKTIADKCLIEGSFAYGENILLLDEHDNPCGILNQVLKEGKQYLTYSHKLLLPGANQTTHKKYKLGFLDKQTSIAIYQYFYGLSPLKPMKYACYSKAIPELLFISVGIPKATLVIDFGTSNTAAGAYIDSQNYHPIVQKELQKSGIPLDAVHKVVFETGQQETAETAPTIVSVKSCLPDGRIVCRFGYDAQRHTIQNSFGGKESCFYNIKKWVNSFQGQTEVYDEEGNFAVVSKREILYQYFQFIISQAQRQHKCRYQNLHITCPIKQKEQYLEMFQYVLGEKYHVETKEALDEGVAVLYNTISGQIEKGNFDTYEKYKALIIDCGGGTTDLTSCRYAIGEEQITYRLDLKTVYANGDVNFGGNNITFRVFQYLKILFAKYYRFGQRMSVNSLIDAQPSEVYELVDQWGVDGIYEKLEEQFDQAEETLPTKFFDYRDDTAERYNQVRSNFYFLWNLAEQMKIDFYQGNGAAYSHFHQYGVSQKEQGAKLIAEQSWKLNIAVQGELLLYTALPQIVITKEEMNLLIMGDIYAMIKKFMEPLYEDGQLADIHLIKLTGQTCKIEIFRDALKEFIPGKRIASAKKRNAEQYYKLTCVQGAIQFENAKKIGLIAPVLSNQPPHLTYELASTTFKGEEITLLHQFDRLSGTYGSVSRNIQTKKIPFLLKNSEGHFLHQYQHFVDFESFRQTSYEEMAEKAEDTFIRQEDIDNIEENEMKLFAYCNNSKWGFTVLPLARKNGILYRGEERYYPFENDEWKLDFFDGRK